MIDLKKKKKEKEKKKKKEKKISTLEIRNSLSLRFGE